MPNKFTSIINSINHCVLKVLERTGDSEFIVEELKVKFSSKVSLIRSPLQSDREEQAFDDNFEDSLYMTSQKFTRERTHNDKKMTHTNVIFRTENINIDVRGGDDNF